MHLTLHPIGPLKLLMLPKSIIVIAELDPRVLS